MIGAIKTIKAKGFASFREEVEIEFSKGVNFISGLNHAGKSVIGLILAEVLADVGPRSKKTMITDGEPETTIEIVTYGGDEIFYSRGRDGSVYRSVNGIEETSASLTKALKETIDFLMVDKGTPSAPDHDLVNIRLSKDSLYFIGTEYGGTAQYQIIQQLTRTEDLANAERVALKSGTKAKRKLEDLADAKAEAHKEYLEVKNKLKNQRSKEEITSEKDRINLELSYLEKSKQIKSHLNEIVEIDLKLNEIDDIDKKLEYVQKADTLKTKVTMIEDKVPSLAFNDQVYDYISKAFILGDEVADLNKSFARLSEIQDVASSLKGLDKKLLELAGICPYCGSEVGDTGCQH